MKKEARCVHCGKWIGHDFYGGPRAWIHIYKRRIYCIGGVNTGTYAAPPTQSGEGG